MNYADWIRELCPEIAQWQVELITEAIDKAVAAEREACARICDERERPNLYGVKECAAAIRERNN